MHVLTDNNQYGLSSLSVMATAGNVYINFGLWGIALLPAWLVVKEIGVTLGDKKVERERETGSESESGGSE